MTRALKVIPVAVLPVVALLIASTVVGAAAAASKTSRAAATRTDVSSNWSGYVVDGLDSTTGASRSFTAVSGSWVQPAANCSSVRSTGPTSSAFWVGLGGNSTVSNALEQTGTQADCDAYGNASYAVWYELVPRPSVKVGLKIAPGDTISASVAVHGRRVTLQVKNVSRGTSFSKTLATEAPDTTSAEWIAEAPSLCPSSDRCRQVALTDFGTVKFADAAATGDGHTGTISDPAWTATSVQLSGRLGGDRFGRFGGELTAAQADPTALRGGGAAFSISWRSGVSAGVPGYQDPGGYGRGYPPDPYSA